MKIKIFLKGVTRGQREFGESITVIINSVLLSIVYFVGIGFTSIFAKISGKHFLDLKTKKQIEIFVQGVFVQIGSIPATGFVKDLVDFNKKD